MDTLSLALLRKSKVLENSGVVGLKNFDNLDCFSDTLFLASLRNMNETIKGYKKGGVGGSISTFNALPYTNIENLVVGIEPIQDLHGYSNPWVGGSGKNLLPMILEKLKEYNTDGTWSGNSYTWSGVTYTVNTDSDGNIESISVNGTASQNTLFQFAANNRIGLDFLPTGEYIVTGCPSGGSGTTYMLQMRVGDSWLEDVGDGKRFNYTNGVATVAQPCRIRIISGYTANNLVYKPMIRLASVTDATYEPYENICPISGWNSVSVARSGKNLLPYPYLETTKTVNGITFTDNGDGTISASGTATANAQFTTYTRAIDPFTLPVGTYIVSGCPSGGALSTYEIAINDTVNGANHIVCRDYGDGASFEVTDSTHKYGLYLMVMSGQTVNFTFSLMIRLASEADATYEPYNGQTYTTDLTQTVYGGTIDVVSGVMTLTHLYTDLGDLTWTAYNNTAEFGGLFYTDNLKTTIAYTDSTKIYTQCSAYNSVPNTQSGKIGLSNEFPDGGIRVRNSDGRLYIRNDRYSTSDGTTFKTAVTGVQLVYELATPQTVQLTPQTIKALKGINNIWCNTGDIISFNYYGV